MSDPFSFFKERFAYGRSVIGNIKDFSVFDLEARPKRVFLREEAKELIEMLALYVLSKLSQSVLVLGLRGTGKTSNVLVAAEAAKVEDGATVFYVNLRTANTYTKIYTAFTGRNGRGLSWSELLDDIVEACSQPPCIVVLDDLLYSLSRRSKAFTVVVTQDYHFEEKLSESVKSSLLPHILFFREYQQRELYEILKLRAEDGLAEWDDAALRHLAALVARDFRGDARVAIRALYYLGLNAKWGEGDIQRALSLASKEIERDALEKLLFKDLVVLFFVTKDEDTVEAYAHAEQFLRDHGLSMSKPTFFKTLSYLQGLGLIFLAKKKANRSYTYEVKHLLADPDVVSQILEKHLRT